MARVCLVVEDEPNDWGASEVPAKPNVWKMYVDSRQSSNELV
jgi:hypothetical protein